MVGACLRVCGKRATQCHCKMQHNSKKYPLWPLHINSALELSCSNDQMHYELSMWCAVNAKKTATIAPNCPRATLTWCHRQNVQLNCNFKKLPMQVVYEPFVYFPFSQSVAVALHCFCGSWLNDHISIFFSLICVFYSHLTHLTEPRRTYFTVCQYGSDGEVHLSQASVIRWTIEHWWGSWRLRQIRNERKNQKSRHFYSQWSRCVCIFRVVVVVIVFALSTMIIFSHYIRFV